MTMRELLDYKAKRTPRDGDGGSHAWSTLRARQNGPIFPEKDVMCLLNKYGSPEGLPEEGY